MQIKSGERIYRLPMVEHVFTAKRGRSKLFEEDGTVVVAAATHPIHIMIERK